MIANNIYKEIKKRHLIAHLVYLFDILIFTLFCQTYIIILILNKVKIKLAELINRFNFASMNYTSSNGQQFSPIENRILECLVGAGAIPVSEIASKSGLSIPCATKYLSSLCSRSLARRAGQTENERGRRAALYEINSTAAYFVGVDPKQTHISLALMDLGGNIVSEKDISHTFINSPETLETICSGVEEFIAENSGKVAGISVNVSGRVNPKTGNSYSIFNFEDRDEPLSKVFSDRFGIPTCIDNDTRAMALAELSLGEGRRFKNFLFINAGWGIGMVIIIDGKIHSGAGGYSGEFGHTNVFDNGKMCHCGKKGCLETEVSGKALCEQMHERLASGDSSYLSSLKNITERDIVEAALTGEDPLSIELLEHAGYLLGKQIANLINIFNPEAVIIGGSLSEAGDYFLQPIIQAVRRFALKLMYKDTSILPSRLGNRAGVLGACLSARINGKDRL